MRKTHLTSAFITLVLFGSMFDLYSQSNNHPHLYFDRAGMDALRDRVLTNPRLNKIWQKYKRFQIDKEAMNLIVADGPIPNQDEGRDYGNALADLTIAYIVLRDQKYVSKAKEIALKLAEKANWGEQLSIAHIDIGLAFCWDVMFDKFSTSERKRIRTAARTKANNHINTNPLSNHNWTPSAGEGLIGLAFQFTSLLESAKQNFKEGPLSVLWAHGTDGFSPQGLAYWRKYNHMALFMYALRFNEPENDWFHLGKEFPGSEFLRNSSYPRIYADVQHADLSCLTWGDSKVVGFSRQGSYGNIGALTLGASEYKDGYILDFIDYLINDVGFRVESEDAAAFVLFNDDGVPSKSYRDLPLSGYWPNMEGAIFRSGWDKNAMVFFMRCGSPGGHVVPLKNLRTDKHNHPDANGFVLFYNNDYLAAEDGQSPQFGPDHRLKVTYGHNTFLIDGGGQKGDKSLRTRKTSANMDYLDAEHVGYLLGDATDAYQDLNRFYRYVIYKKHKYFIIVDELKDDVSHKYEFLLGLDRRHFITSTASNEFRVKPTIGSAKLPIVFVEPRAIRSSIKKERYYVYSKTPVDLLRVWPTQDARNAHFFTLLYPLKTGDPQPQYTKIYDGGRSGIRVGSDEYHLYNDSNALYSFGNISTDAKLCYFKDDPTAFEYLAAGSNAFLYRGTTGISSDKPLVAAFKGTSGKIRLGKNLGVAGMATITLFYPGITGIMVDGQLKQLVHSAPGEVTFKLSPKQFKTGPTGYEQTVTDNYEVVMLTGAPPTFLQIASPNGGESWQIGSVQSIQWTSDGSFANVKIEYSTNNGLDWQTISLSSANNGQLNWTVPNTTSDNALVRISDGVDGVPSDVSDLVFSIVDGTPRVPIVTSFQPTSGPFGTKVTILGSNFDGATQIGFNDVSAANFSVVSNSEILVAVPVGASTGRINITNVFGTGISTDDFIVETGGGSGSEIKTFFPTDDAFVWSRKPSNNYGNSAALRVRKSRKVQVAYFKFAVSGLSGQVVSAKLRLHVLDSSNDGGSAYATDNHFNNSLTPWDEAGLVWTNAPVIIGLPLSSLGPVSSGETVEFDVTAAINGNGTYSIAIRNNSRDVLMYGSKENALSPELEIQTGTGSTVAAKLAKKTALPLKNTLQISRKLMLAANYPNPFNIETTIKYGLPQATEVQLVVYNLRGHEVQTLVDEYQSAGLKTVRWNGRDILGNEVSSGIYFIRLEAGHTALTRKLILQK